MYLKERLRRLLPGRFIDVGAGDGRLSRLLLDSGWSGTGFEPGPAATTARALTAEAVAAGRYVLMAENWLEAPAQPPAELIISSMVLEHLDAADEHRYFRRAENELTAGGFAILIVPGSPAHWGVEDEIAGHYRRYTFASLERTLAEVGWTATHLAGLTFPVSNLLWFMSEYLVARAEGHKKTLTFAERTAQSGDRRVFLKTRFPAVLSVVLNEWVLYPFHLWQKANADNERSLVIYVECRPAGGAARPGSDVSPTRSEIPA